MKSPSKYHHQTPLNQRCHDDQERQTAGRALFQTTFTVSDFGLECFDRQYHRHHADGKGVHDWRHAAVAAVLVVALAIGNGLSAMAASLPPLPPLPPVKKTYKSAAITQGAGAQALLAKAVPTVTRYYAVTATTTNALESDYSNEVTNTAKRVTLAWDPSPSPAIAAYILYEGGATRTYTNRQNVGLALTAQWPPPPKTNMVVTITGTNLQSAPTLLGPWTAAAPVTLTNPPAIRFYRGPGARIVTSRY